jgi:hypothetical protein
MNHCRKLEYFPSEEEEKQSEVINENSKNIEIIDKFSLPIVKNDLNAIKADKSNDKIDFNLIKIVEDIVERILERKLLNKQVNKKRKLTTPFENKVSPNKFKKAKTNQPNWIFVKR